MGGWEPQYIQSRADGDEGRKAVATSSFFLPFCLHQSSTDLFHASTNCAFPIRVIRAIRGSLVFFASACPALDLTVSALLSQISTH
jgi:hypothetical protein